VRYDLTGFEWRVVEPGDRGVAAKSAILRIFCRRLFAECELVHQLARWDEWNAIQHATWIATNLGVRLPQARYSAPTAARPAAGGDIRWPANPRRSGRRAPASSSRQ
jgi:hypothetical protein